MFGEGKDCCSITFRYQHDQLFCVLRRYFGEVLICLLLHMCSDGIEGTAASTLPIISYSCAENVFL